MYFTFISYYITHYTSVFIKLFYYRTATARGKGEQADISAVHAREDSDLARIYAKQFAPDFHQPGKLIQQI